MRRRQSVLRQVLWLVVLATAASTAQAAEKYPFRVSALYGVGGAVDNGGSFSNGTYQLGFSWLSNEDIMVGVRVGQLLFDQGPDERQGSDLTYATIGGEYRFNEGYYTSGIYIGLGWYGLEAEAPDFPSDNAIGLVVGLTGDFKLNHRFSILVELSGHYTDLDDADLLGMGHVGVGYRF
jgi:opacity protein-like surface antigen